MSGRQRRAEHRYGVVDARLMQHDDVHVALGDDEGFFGDRTFFRKVECVENFRFIKQRALRRIDVFSRVIAYRATAEAHELARVVVDRKGDALDEACVEPALVLLHRARI